MLYLSYKAHQKKGDHTVSPASGTTAVVQGSPEVGQLSVWAKRWANAFLAATWLFIIGVVQQGNGDKPHPLRVLGVLLRYVSYGGLVYQAAKVNDTHEL